MNYTVLIATNRPGSRSSQVAQIYQRILIEKGITPTVLSLQDLPKDFIFSNMFGKKHPDFIPMQEVVFKTDKFIFVIPEYNGGFPGVLKAFIDGCKFPESFMEKKCCIVGVSDGQFGNLRGIEHFTGIANYIKMDVLHTKLYLMDINTIMTEDGAMKDEAYIRRISRQIDAFIKM